MRKFLVPVLSLPGAAMSKKTKKKCSRPGCGKDAASPRAKFCMACFKTNASLASAQRKSFRGGGGGGVPGNRGNSKGAPGNRGNTTAGRKKMLAGKRSALRRSTKLVLVVKTPWLDLILAKKEDVDLLVKSAQYECLACSAARQSC